jgi:uncharacterized protein
VVKLHLAAASSQNMISGYGPDYVAINGRRYERSVIVMPDRIIEDWSATSFDALAEAHFLTLAELRPEILLLGTGAALHFPEMRLTRALSAARIGLEVMDTHAACRTYNILLGEGRQVAAALLLG